MEDSSYFRRSACGSTEKIDLTLRLGLPVNDHQMQDSNGKIFPIHGKCELKYLKSRLGSKKCNHCGNDDTPMWRGGPTGPQTLCNACGLRYARLIKKRSLLLEQNLTAQAILQRTLRH